METCKSRLSWKIISCNGNDYTTAMAMVMAVVGRNVTGSGDPENYLYKGLLVSVGNQVVSTQSTTSQIMPLLIRRCVFLSDKSL